MNKNINIDFLYLDLNTCERCQTTDETLNEALAILEPIFEVLNISALVNKVKITTKDQAYQYQFLSSPTIRVNGIDIDSNVLENDCSDCGELAGCAIDCRVFYYDGKEYEQPPVGMIVEGILRNLFLNNQTKENEYVLPDNLSKFFESINDVSSEKTDDV